MGGGWKGNSRERHGGQVGIVKGLVIEADWR